MTYGIKAAKWLFWATALLCYRPKTFNGLMWKRKLVGFPPWQKFKPYVFHNKTGRQWEVYFTDEVPVSRQQKLTVVAHIGQESGKIVGLTIHEENL